MIANKEEAEKMTDVEKIAALAFDLARQIVWLDAHNGIKKTFDPGEDGHTHIGEDIVRKAHALLVMVPDTFLGGGKAIIVPKDTSPEMAEFIKEHPFHMAAILMKYPEQLPKIVVPTDPWENKNK